MSRPTRIIQKEDAYEALKPFLGCIRQPLDLAWQDWRTHYSTTRHILTATAQANVIWSHTWNHVRTTFAEVSHATIIEQNGIHAVAFVTSAGPFLLRYKKLDVARMSRNVRTLQSRAFRSQMRIEGLPKAIHVEAGYILNSTGTGVDSFELVCPKATGINWSFDLPTLNVSAEPLPLFTPSAPTTTATVVLTKLRDEESEGR